MKDINYTEIILSYFVIKKNKNFHYLYHTDIAVSQLHLLNFAEQWFRTVPKEYQPKWLQITVRIANSS
jgi:hypothetical protein